MEIVKVDVKTCARCEGDHSQLEFKLLGIPAGEWTHWTMCPTTNEPILLTVIPEEGK